LGHRPAPIDLMLLPPPALNRRAIRLYEAHRSTSRSARFGAPEA
jgi:hypothetical protein